MKNIGQERVTHGWKCVESFKTEVIATSVETPEVLMHLNTVWQMNSVPEF